MQNITLVNPDKCTGCGMCYNICPTKAIDMIADDEGFHIPHVNENCVDCGLCLSRCPQMKNPLLLRAEHCYAVIAKNKYREKASSGGVFPALASYIIEKNGVVFGAAFNDDYSAVKHIAVDKQSDLSKILKSKYVQSDINNSFRQAKALLEQGRLVLFSGCPCQIDGLKSYLGRDYESLITVDILCHGVPSPLAYRKFLAEISQRENKQIIDVDFRDRKYGWGKLIRILFSDSSSHYDYNNENYLRAFTDGVLLRDSCFSCKYATTHRAGDMTLGDFWGIKNYEERLDDGKGTSLVMCNTAKAIALFKAVANKFSVVMEVPFDDVTKICNKANGALVRSMNKPQMRKCFFRHLQKGDSFSVACRYAATSLLDVGILGWWIETPRSNYGSTLTNFALYRYLLSLGLSVAFVSPPNFDRKYAGGFNLRNSYRMTAKYDADNMKENNRYIDTFLVASDVLWYYDAFIKTGYFFMLDFVDDNKRKISYATSFGNTQRFFPQEEMLKAHTLLKRFDSISVRETEGVAICKERFGVEATQVLDPVFLCDKDEWDRLADLAETKTRGDFLFVYMLDPTEEKAKSLVKIAKSLSLDIVSITDKQFNADEKAQILKKCGLLKNASIEDLIYHIKNAKFVITDSYHGMCFSLIMRKQFATLINRSRGASRFDTLIELFKIGERVVENVYELESNAKKLSNYEYGMTSMLIENEIERSKEWLNHALFSKRLPKMFSEYDMLAQELISIKERLSKLEKQSK